jgi:hypothetical protein
MEAAVVPAFVKTTFVTVAGEPNIDRGAATFNQTLSWVLGIWTFPEYEPILTFTVVATEDFTENLKFANPVVDIPLVLARVINPFTAKLVEHTQAELEIPPVVQVDPVNVQPELTAF